MRLATRRGPTSRHRRELGGLQVAPPQVGRGPPFGIPGTRRVRAGAAGLGRARLDEATTADGRGPRAQALPARAGWKSWPGRLVEAPVGACPEESPATHFLALQVAGRVQALAQLDRRARRRKEAGRGLEPAPVLLGATTPSSSRSSTGRAGRDRGPEVRPRAPHRPLHARHDPGHPLHRCRTARRPQPPPDTPLAPRPLNPSPRPFAQALARCRLTSSRLDGGAARRRSGGGLARPGRPGDPAARGRHGGGAGARRGAPEALGPACEWGPGGVPLTGTFFPCAPHA